MTFTKLDLPLPDLPAIAMFTSATSFELSSCTAGSTYDINVAILYELLTNFY